MRAPKLVPCWEVARLVIVITAILSFAACESEILSEESSPASVSTDSQGRGLFGQLVEVSEGGKGRNRTERHEVAGTVAQLVVSFPLGGTYGCSGTLITRRHILTAAHCVIHLGVHATGVDATFSQEKVSYSGQVIDYLSSHSGPRDLALIELDAEVDAAVVEHPARVFSGSWSRMQMQGHLRTGNGQYWTAPQAVGYGQESREEGCDDCGWGTRRLGPVMTLFLDHESWCMPDPFGWSDCEVGSRLVDDHAFEPDTYMALGDSGGPLFVWLEGQGFVVVGVASYTEEFLGPWAQSWAPVFDAPDTQNAAFVAQVLEDQDNDGWLDLVDDNCPPSSCRPYGRDCSNADQADDDGDGNGDVCDLCRASVCSALSAIDPVRALDFTCVTQEQADQDLDGIGDTCDLCPYTPRSLPDSDSDLIGDMCDGCSALRTGYASCTISDPMCPYPATCIVAADAPNGRGHCSVEADDDDDGIPVACDLCDGLQSRDRRNSNAEIEAARNTVARGDVCDTVPLVRLEDPAPAEVWPSVYVQGDGHIGPEEELTLYGRSWLGDDGLDNTQLGGSQDIAFRQCDCWDSALPQPYGETVPECADPGERCTPLNANLGAAPYVPITVRTPSGQSIPAAGGDPQAFTEASDGPRRTWIWSHWDDVAGASSTVPWHTTSEGHRGTFGVVAAVVRFPGVPMDVPRDAAKELRTTLTLVRTPYYYLVDPLDGLSEPGGTCLTPNCLRELRPAEWIVDPEDLRSRLPDVALLLPKEAAPGTVGLQVPGAFTDVAPFISAELAALLAEPAEQWAWATPVEPQELLAARQLPVAAVLVPAEGGADARPQPVVWYKGALELADEPAVRTPVDPSLPLEAAVQVPKDGRVVYAASKGLLFVAGGRYGTGLVGRQTIRRFDLETGAWQPIGDAFEHHPELDVVGLAFDAALDRLYILDAAAVPTGPTTSEERVRLLAFDLRSGKSFELWSVEHTHEAAFTSLSLDESGALVLLAANASSYSAWRVDPNLDAPVFTGRLTRSGTVLDQPVMGWRELRVPVRTSAGIMHHTLRPSDFDAGAPPAGL